MKVKSFAGTVIIGIVSGSGKPLEALLFNPKILLILVVAILLFVPLCYFGARWMFNHTYSKHLQRLKASIDELS